MVFFGQLYSAIYNFCNPVWIQPILSTSASITDEFSYLTLPPKIKPNASLSFFV